jgi:hypothetical protein
MINPKLALVAAAVAITFALPAFAKTVRHSQNDTAAGQQFHNSTAAAPPASQVQNPYYASYANQAQSSGNFIIPYGSH